MNTINRVQFLEETHRILDVEIQRLEKTNPFNPAIIDLKKQKLKIKDDIENLKKIQLDN
jgi:uncharacterized protein YdcH (DUF465 family)